MSDLYKKNTENNFRSKNSYLSFFYKSHFSEQKLMFTELMAAAAADSNKYGKRTFKLVKLLSDNERLN